MLSPLPPPLSSPALCLEGIKVMYVCDFAVLFVIEGNVKGSSEAFLGYALGKFRACAKGNNDIFFN